MVCAVHIRIEIDYARRRGLIHAVEKQQLNRCGLLGKHAEIGAVFGERRTQRKAFAAMLGIDGGHGGSSGCIVSDWVFPAKRFLLVGHLGINAAQHCTPWNSTLTENTSRT